MIKKEKSGYVLYSSDGKKKLFKSTSYAAVVQREQEIEVFKKKAREKRGKK